MSKLAAVAVGLFVLLMPRVAAAHILVRDQTGQYGAIMHINPADDPIAGQPSSLDFEMESGERIEQNHTFILSVSDDQGKIATAPVTVAGDSIVARFTFPVQGLYTVSLLARPTTAGGQTVLFSRTQQVSRGTHGAGRTQPEPAWVDFGMLFSLGALLIVGVMVIDRRQRIGAYSK